LPAQHPVPRPDPTTDTKETEMKKLLAISVMALGLAAAFPASYAQTEDPAGAPAGRAMMHRHQDSAFRLTDRVEARLAYIRTALKITAAQQLQWDAYAGVLRRQAGMMEKRMQERRAQFDKGATERRRPSLVERHEHQRERMIQASQRMDELLAVEKPLYAVLTPEQQRIADEVLAPRGRGGHGGPGRFHRAGFGRG
jgi:hypothetical protein